MSRGDAARRVAELGWIDSVVSVVWVGLTALMLVAAWLLYRQAGGFTWRVWLVLAVIAATWLYPLYSAGFALRPGFVANIAYGLLVLGVIVAVLPRSRPASALLVPILAWVGLATYYVWLQIVAGPAS